MATTYISDAVLVKALADRFGSTPDRLVAESYWQPIIADANQSAYQLIRSTLLGRGYTGDAIDAWDRRAEFNRRIGLCHALTEYALLKDGVNTVALDRVCLCEKELDTVVLDAGGEVQAPTGGGATVSRGEMRSCTDVFSMDMRG